MPITITITDPTPEQIAALFGAPASLSTEWAFVEADALAVAAQINKGVGKTNSSIRAAAAEQAPPKPKVNTKRTAAQEETIAAGTEVSPEDAEMAREMAADIEQAEPEPTGARQIVDAGTGQPVGQAAGEVTLTMDEVRANATRLAQADSGRLKAILGEFGAAKLSEVAADSLPDFAAKVLAALG